VHVHDALFGFTRTGTVELTFPNGRPQRFQLDKGGWLHLPTVPRGDYVIRVLGPGPHLPAPMTMSRNQTIDVGFFSWLDAVVVLGVALVLAAVLAMVGWFRRRPGRGDRRELQPDDEPNFVVPGQHEDAEEVAVPAPRSEHSSDLVVASDHNSR
jgi:hypothetical protein